MSIPPGTARGRPRHGATWAIAFAAVILLANPLHELGHWIAFSLVGIPAAISFDHTYFTVRWEPSLAGAAGGPLASLALAWAGALLVLRRRLEPLGYALAIVMPLTRLGTYAICALVPRASLAVNDEGVMALHCGWPTWAWAWLLLPLLLGPWFLAWRAWAAPPLGKVVRFAAVVAAWVGLALILEVGILEPRLFPAAGRRELVMPHPPR